MAFLGAGAAAFFAAFIAFIAMAFGLSGLRVDKADACNCLFRLLNQIFSERL